MNAITAPLAGVLQVWRRRWPALTFGALAIVFLVGKVDIARGYFVLALPVGAVALLGSRWMWRRWLMAQRRYDHYLSRAIVVGDPDDVGYVAEQIRAKSGAAYQVVGVAQGGKLSVLNEYPAR